MLNVTLTRVRYFKHSHTASDQLVTCRPQLAHSVSGLVCNPCATDRTTKLFSGLICMPEPSTAAGECSPLLQTVQRPERDNTTVVIAPEICHSHSSSSVRNLRREASSGSNAPSCSSNSHPVLGTCRICFETDTSPSQDPANPLICPCMCSGSSKYVHRQCLEQWRNTNHRADAYWQCEVCKYK